MPFLAPLLRPTDAEIERAEKKWSEWLLMEDWLIGPRAPECQQGNGMDADLSESLA